MEERFDYVVLKDMAEFSAKNNESVDIRVEIIEAICELPEVNIPWKKLDPKILLYYAENPEDRLPCHPFYIKRQIVDMVGPGGCFRVNEHSGKVEYQID